MRNFLPTKNVCFGVIFFAALIFVFVGAPKVFAAPPFSPYAPGETTNPSCGPTDPNCTVTPPLAATTTLTTGSVPFIGNASGTVYENNANLFWNNTTDRFGIGTAAPATTLEVNGNIRDDNVLNAPCIGTDSLGDLIVGTCTGGGSSSSSFIVTAPITYNASTTAIGLNYANSNGPGGINLENIFGSLEASLATTSISQFVNDAGYVTSTNSGVSSFNTQTGAATYSVTCVSGCSATTSTTGTALTVTGGGTGALSTSSAVTAFNFPYWSNITGGLSGTSTLFFSSSTGNVGIGMAAPATKLDVNGDITDENIISSPFLATNGTGKLIAVTTATLRGYTDSFGYATSSAGLSSYNVTSANPFISVSTTTTSAALTFSTSSFGSNAFNSTAFLATSTGLTTANFATTSISQFANDAGYITTSTNNFGGLTNASITAISPIVWSSTSTISCPTCLSGSQTVTLTGAVTGSGTTSIATTFTTSTLYGLFSGGAPITFNTSTGAIGWTNSLGYITTSSISINGVQGNVFTGLATSTGIASYNVTSANPFISVSTTTTSAALTFSTSSFGSNAFNSTAFLSTSTGLTAANFATTSVSQFANDAGYISSLSGALLSTNNLSDLASATAARSNLGLGSAATHPTTDFLASSTAYVSTFNGASGAVTGIATNTGNWAGTWQGVNSSSFYLASNPSNYISTSTGLTTANFATTSISQWANDAHYITTSTNNFGGITLNSLSGAAPITYNTSTGAIGWTNSLGYITTSSISINGVQGNVFTGLATSTGIPSYTVTSANPFISISTTTTSAALTFSTSSFGSNAFTSTAYYPNANPSSFIALTALSASGTPLTYNSSTGIFTFTNPGYLTSLSGALLAANNLSDLASATAARSNLGLGSIATHSAGDYLASSTAFVSTFNGASGAVTGIATNTGNWAGTWQGVNSSSFYLASNPSNYISTSTGLTTANFATTSISQWANDAHYITTSTNNFGGLTNASITALSPILWSSTSTISCPTCLTSNQTVTLTGAVTGSGTTSIATTFTTSTLYALFSATNPITYNTSTGAIGWTNSNNYISSSTGNGLYLQIANNLSELTNTSTARTNLGLGSAATHPATDFLASSTTYVASLLSTTTAGGINFSATTGSNITGILNSLAITQFTGVLPIANGGSNATSAAAALANFGGISTSTYNASITIATAAPLGGGGSLSNGTTLNLTCTGCLTSLSGAMLVANNGSDINNTSTFRTNLGLGSIATHPTTDFLSSSTAYVSTFNGTSSVINFNVIGTGNVTTSVATSGGNTTTTISLTGVIPAANGGTATTTALGADAFSTSTIYGAGAYLGTSGSNLTVSSTLASSTWNFVIDNATTTNNTTNIMEWTTPQSVNINSIACHDTVATTTIYFFIPTSDTATTNSSTILSSFTCGIGGQTTSTNLTYPAGQAFIVEVTSTVGTPVTTPVHITYTKL